MTDEAWAKSVLEGLQETKERCSKDPKSTAAYWNGDDWGSISGIRDANAWLDRQEIKYLLQRVNSRYKKSESERNNVGQHQNL